MVCILKGMNRSGAVALLLVVCSVAGAQSIGSGTVTGTVVDPSGAAVPDAAITIHNPVTNYRQSAKSDSAGAFRLTNVPPNSYHVEAAAANFQTYNQDISIRTAVPITLTIKLQIAGGETTVNVEAAGADVLENVSYAHNDVDAGALNRLPLSSPGSGLSDAITLSTPGVVADSNGFFHPLGDHAQTSYVVDGQPINDQQSKSFSTQLPENAFQSLELVTGMAPAQYGDKTSLVVDAVTRSGLGKKPFGQFEASYGSFGTIAERGSIGWGGPKAGNFLVANGMRSGRFLDTPEFWPAHAVGNNTTLFDRLDYHPSAVDSLHLNLSAARNSFQVPNTYDQPEQDQRQKVVSFNIAPGYQRTFGATTLLTINPWVRRDLVNYYPSGDPFHDMPATISQRRTLLNYGARADLAIVSGRHNLKIGTELKQTRLDEAFGLGITDPAFNAVCLDRDNQPVPAPGITNPANCARAGFAANPDLLPGLIPYDLTRGGRLLQFAADGNVSQAAAYVQDTITLGNWVVNGGLRLDRYSGPSTATSLQPRIGVSYLVKSTGTVLRASYARTMETPYNENLLLSSSSGVGGLASNVFGAFEAAPLKPGRRNQFNAGFQQALGKYLLFDGDYFWKFTDHAYDFGVLFDTPVAFPIAWRKSKLDGVGARLSSTNIKGFQAYITMGHTRARFFGPETGGLIFNSPVDASVFRIDHDQAFQQTTNVRYQRPNHGPWVDFTWRYDSGLVAGAVASLDDALALSGARQAAIGFYCGDRRATPGNPIESCTGTYGATRLNIPAPGTADPDTNPPRLRPRHIFNASVGTDNLLRTEHARVTLRLTVLNIGNHASLYNFLSTFSGTHFVTPRSYHASIGLVF